MRIFFIIIAAGLAALAGCQKRLAVDPVGSFGVTADSAAYHAGSIATFTFSGNPDIITFYSGELGHRYTYRSRIDAAGTPKLQFTSALNAGAQPNSLLLLVSTDFKGVVVGDTVTTKTNMSTATWTDITSRATLATGATAVASGAIDLSDIAAGGKPIYIAFKYLATAGSIQNKWTITGLSVTNSLPDNTVYTIANLAASNTPITSNYAGVNTFSPGWVTYTVSNTYAWTVTAGTSLVIAGAATVPLATASAESWTFVGPVDLQKVTPDVGVPIKLITATLPSYQYAYSTTGSYNAVFFAANATASRMDSVTRTVGITVK